MMNHKQGVRTRDQNDQNAAGSKSDESKRMSAVGGYANHTPNH